MWYARDPGEMEEWGVVDFENIGTWMLKDRVYRDNRLRGSEGD